jgi:hypothetical protein
MKYSKQILLGLTLVLILFDSNGVQIANAERITIEKPFEPVIIDQGAIPRPSRYQRADPLEIMCRLEAGHKYHIFLVGEWIANVTGAEGILTDYDIEVFDSQNVLVSLSHPKQISTAS